MRFYNGGEQGLFTGKIPVEGPGCHAGLFDDLTQGCAQKAFVRKFFHAGLKNIFQCIR